jgi:hypothetical protein
MKKKKLTLLVVLIALVCCVGLTAGIPGDVSAAKKKVTPTLVAQGQAVKAAKAVLAKKFGIKASQISLVEVKAATWPDSCLGLAEDGEMCAQMLTKGYRIVLLARGAQYVVRTNKNGTAARIE